MPFIRTAGCLLALSLAQTALSQTCESYGLDFQNGGTYFQNSLSTAPFTASQEFSGCQNDTADNVLVDPSGNQYECSQTPLLPSDTPETVTCPLDKDQLTSGDWSLLIISNNGDGTPIAYERDFSLTVGPQQTTTYTPTITISDTVTPVASSTTTTTTYVTSVASPSTTTVAAAPPATVTRHPSPVVSKTTKALLTITQTSKSVAVAQVTTSVTATCAKQTPVKDPVASVLPTVLGDLDNVVKTLLGGVDGVINDILKGRAPAPTAMPASAKFKRAILEGRAVEEDVKQAFVKERRDSLAKLQKRAPDQPTITVTDTDTADYTTVTSTSTAPTQTAYVTTTVVATTTSTPAPVTVSSGRAQVVTVTAAPSTLVETVWIAVTDVSTKVTATQTITHTSTITPASFACSVF